MTRSLSPFLARWPHSKWGMGERRGEKITGSSIIRVVGDVGICQLGVKSGLGDKSIELVILLNPIFRFFSLCLSHYHLIVLI